MRMTPTVHERRLLETAGIEGYAYENTRTELGRRYCRGQAKRKLVFEKEEGDEQLSGMCGFNSSKEGYVEDDLPNRQQADSNIDRLRMITEQAGKNGNRLQSMLFAVSLNIIMKPL